MNVGKALLPKDNTPQVEKKRNGPKLNQNVP